MRPWQVAVQLTDSICVLKNEWVQLEAQQSVWVAVSQR
jgi:hypothetical protein